jgi:anti-sigma regulatory factor (Ser/Thr protein kinase)
MTTRTSEQVFAGLPAQVGEARRWTGRRLADAGVCPEAADIAVLCVSELATNAIQHSRSGEGGRFRVRVITVPGVWLRIEVRDEGPRVRPAGRADVDPLPDGGRGLRLVRELTTESGGDGTVHWFRLLWRAGAPAAAAGSDDGALFALGGGGL